MPSFIRKIKIQIRYTNNGGEVRAALEDDYHHFRVCLHFDENRITYIDASSPRIPFISCPQATTELQTLIGTPLLNAANDIIKQTNASLHCTHLLDLTGLALAAASKGIPYRNYEVHIPRHVDKKTNATLIMDNHLKLTWCIEDNTFISAPSPYAGRPIGKGFAKWARETLSNDEAEAALVLRRCAIISLGRFKNLDAIVHAKPAGVCYAQQPHRAQQATRVIGSTFDFSDNDEQLCLDDANWLEFRDKNDI
tara:strand:+ start:18614 stop:19369 length:756 start_codon:yes stop_codon:yes gene_type:complete